MSLRQLVEGDCGGVNPLMQLGGQFTRDAARKDEGFARAQFERSLQQDEQMVHEFLGQVAGPPQSFQMETLLQEMREIEQANGAMAQLQPAPRIADQMTGKWAEEFAMHQAPPPLPMQMVNMQPQHQQMTHVREFFDEATGFSPQMESGPRFMPQPAPYLAICPPYVPRTDDFFEQPKVLVNYLRDEESNESMQDWINDYQTSREENEQTASNYKETFWQRMQDEFEKLSKESEHPWLSEYSEAYDPYKEYTFAEENPMAELENALEKGKEYLSKGDIPSAVLCFEVAAKKEPENPEVWELLGISQAENEMDPQAIAALKRSLQVNDQSPRVLMALAVCYTNESLHSHALRMLNNWLLINPKYKHLVDQNSEIQTEAGAIPTSLIRGDKLRDVQEMFLEAARLNPTAPDAEIQEALGVLYNLSSEFDKAVDCFKAALQIDPQNAKIWNRLGASLANGSRSTEAVEAYQQALQLKPGFIRVRYNVGVCCMNLKAYKQAVEHLLIALNLQANTAALRELPIGAGAIGTGHQMSESIWSTLKMIISLMGRNDLHTFVNERNLEALNNAFKD